MAKRYLLGLTILVGLAACAEPSVSHAAAATPQADDASYDASRDQYSNGSACSGDSWSAQRPDRAGALTCNRGVLHFELRPGDVTPLDARRNHPVERSEIAARYKQAPRGEFWFSFAMRIEPGPPVTSKWVELGQLHSTQDPGAPSLQPPFAQGLDQDDRFRVIVRTTADQGRNADRGLAPGKPTTTILYRQPDFPRGAFHMFVYRINYTPTADGAVDMWLDGAQKIAYRGPVGYSDRTGPYLKFGIYRDPSQERLGVDYANIEVGGPELRDRIGHPRPVPAD